MQAATVQSLNNKTIGDEFERSFLNALMAAGYYVQQMPPRIGYDFSVGINGKHWPVELKCTLGGILRLKHFTQIELHIAEDMTAHNLPYYVAYPLLSGFGVTTWSRVRLALLNRETIILDRTKAVLWLPNKEFITAFNKLKEVR